MIDFQWVLDNLGEIGLSGVLLIFVWFLVDEKIILGPYHRRELEAGKEAIELLEKLNPQLKELEILAAVQKIRDEYGAKEAEELRMELQECKTDLGLCRKQQVQT